MTQKITGEAPFQILASNFSISPSLQNYVLQISADGTNYSDLFTVSAGQTKMVTNVANGSYYRLKNNNSEVTINWRTQCNDGQGGGGGSYILPPATQQTLGGVKVGSGLTVQADGTLSATGGSGSGSSYEPYKIELSSSNPDYFTREDIANLNAFFAAVEENPSIVEGAYIQADTTDIYRCSYAEYNNFTFAISLVGDTRQIELAFENGEYSEGYFISWANNTLIPTYDLPADPVEGQIANYDDGEGNVGLFRYDGEDWVPYGGGDNSSLIPTTGFPADPVEGQIVNYSDERLNVGVLYRYDGSNWQPYGGGAGESDFIHLDSLDTAGEVGKTYEYQGRLMQWVEGSGYTAEWLKNIGQLSERNEGTGLIYTVIPDNTKLFEYKYPYGGEWRYVVYNNGKLYCTETGGTVVASASTGEEFSFPAAQYGNNYQVRGIFKNGYIGFFLNGYVSCQNVWNGSTNNGHFELIDKNNYPYIYNPNEGYIYGVNEKGQAVSKKQSFNTKIVYFNNTGYSNSMGYLTNGSGNGPDRMWVPTTGGQAGQTLVSAGDNSAPVWETRIKVVKITSADYEALVQAGTTDANTLYAIVDE